MAKSVCRSLLGLIFIIVLLNVSISIASASNKIALIIGNADYQFSKLKNSLNDAKDLANLLQNIGFEVILKENAGRKEILYSINEFGQRLSDKRVGFFYYAGHGVQINNRNYLIPVDSKIDNEVDIEIDGVDVDRILGRMESNNNRVNIIILDACRNNPFSSSFRSVNRGLAVVQAPVGSLIAYATAPGSVALDGMGRNGVFTKHLLRHLGTSGISIQEVMTRIRSGVVNETNKKQIPWSHSSLIGKVYLVSGKVSPPPTVNNVSNQELERLHADIAALQQKLAKNNQRNPNPAPTVVSEPKGQGDLLIEFTGKTSDTAAMAVGTLGISLIFSAGEKKFKIFVDDEFVCKTRGYKNVTVRGLEEGKHTLEFIEGYKVRKQEVFEILKNRTTRIRYHYHSDRDFGWERTPLY